MEEQLRDAQDKSINADDDRARRDLSWTHSRRRLDIDQTTFRVYKGVKCFAFSKQKNLLITGGMHLWYYIA